MARTTLSDLRNRRSIVLPNTEQFEWIAVDPAQRLQPGMIVARVNDVVICEEHPEDHQRLREMMERIAQEYSYTWIVQPTSGEISLNRIKKPLLDTLYPHACRNPDCARKLQFNELLLAEGNQKLNEDFRLKIFDYLTEQYNQFDFVTRERWSQIIGYFEFRQYLRRLWKNKNVEFYCCSCAKKAEKGRILDDGRIKVNERSDFFSIQDTMDSLIHAQVISLREQSRQVQEHLPFNPLIERTPEQEYVDDQVRQDIAEMQRMLENDICEGAGLTREQLFGSEDLPRKPFMPHDELYGVDDNYEQSEETMRYQPND